MINYSFNLKGKTVWVEVTYAIIFKSWIYNVIWRYDSKFYLF